MPHAPSPTGGSAPTPGATTHFVRGCFTASLCDVDFTQALPAVEQLALLDERRKREFCSALRRLNVDEATLEQTKASLEETQPAMHRWITALRERSRKAEALYTQVYIGLRRWALINEMRLLPFDKANCTAMLDTLYPPTYSTLPTAQLTALILNAQRDAFLKYIEAVGKHGRSVLRNLENQSKRSTDTNGWPVVHDILERYLKQCNRVIDSCAAIKGPEHFERRHHPALERPPLRNVNTAPASQELRRPATAQASSSPPRQQGPAKLRKDQEEWLAKQRAQQAKQEPPRQLKKSRSTLNRLAQEFRRFKSKSADARTDTPLRSHSALDQRSGHTRSPSAPGTESPTLVRSESRRLVRQPSVEPSMTGSSGTGVTIDDAYRERLIEEAKRNKAVVTREKRQHSPTHFKLEEERRYRAPRAAPFADRPTAAELDDTSAAEAAIEDTDLFFITDAATLRTPHRAHTSHGPLRPRCAELAA